MSTQVPQSSGDSAGDFADHPDARVTIDLKRVEGRWIAYDPNDSETVVGDAETGPRAIEDYGRRVAEYIERQADE